MRTGPLPITKVHCQICQQDVPLNEAVPADLVRESLLPFLKVAAGNSWNPEGYISLEELNKARVLHVQEVLHVEDEGIEKMRKEVIQSLLEHEVLTRNADIQFEQQLTLGQHLADKIATFGGSWTFIISFGVVLACWMIVNSIHIFAKVFDPFPFIFLNLILSCLAAIQAPVIMMSQNRAEQKDRLRGENDYKTNLKAELEIRHLNEKIDRLLNDQWKHLLEIQQMQMEMIDEIKTGHLATVASEMGATDPRIDSRG